MGSLIIPEGGTVYVDAPAVIYTVEAHPIYAPLLRPLWQAAQSQTVHVITSELTLLETLVLPLRNGDIALRDAYERLLVATPEVKMLPLTQAILREAAQLRAGIPGLRTPDALHAATALVAGCALFVTNDKGFHRIQGLPLTILDEVLAA